MWVRESNLPHNTYSTIDSRSYKLHEHELLTNISSLSSHKFINYKITIFFYVNLYLDPILNKEYDRSVNFLPEIMSAVRALFLFGFFKIARSSPIR